MKTVSVSNISELESTIYEEDSYYFLQYYQFHKNWHLYDSDMLGLKTVLYFIDKFSNFHGKIPFPDKKVIDDSYWSSVPLGIFRYKLLSDGTFGLLLKTKKTSGYIVEGAYWDNGFFYLVKDSDDIIQAKLFLDDYTKISRAYPDPHLI